MNGQALELGLLEYLLQSSVANLRAVQYNGGEVRQLEDLSGARVIELHIFQIELTPPSRIRWH